MHVLVALLLAVGSVQGVAKFENSTLPGCTVTLTAQSGERFTRTSDVNGQFRFDALAPGKYVLTFELDGLETLDRAITVSEGANEPVEVQLQLTEVTETIVIACGPLHCRDDPPDSKWSVPTCSDYDLDTSLIDALARADRSAASLIRRRYDGATTFAQKHRLAAALLGRVADDRPFWNELMTHATVAVRFIRDDAQHNPEFLQWCAERGLDPDGYATVVWNALDPVSMDRRSRGLMLEALKTGYGPLISFGVYGLARQHDETALADIERALEAAAEDDRARIAMDLEPYRTSAADLLAFKYFDDEQRAEYLAIRSSQVPPD